MVGKIIQKFNKIISFFWKKKCFRYLAGGLVFLLLFNLVFPSIIKKEIVLANNQIQADEKTEALFVNNNPNFQIEFGNKDNSTENKIRFESLKGQNNPFQNSTTGEIQTQKEDQTLKEKIKKKLGEVQDKISPQKQGIEFKLKEVSTEEITDTPALQESTKQETSLNWKKNLLAFFLPNVQAEVLLQTEKQTESQTENQPQEMLQEETDLLQTLQEELIQMTKDFSVDQSQSEKVFQAITQARTVFSQTQLKKEDNQDIIQNQEVAPNVDIEYQVLEGKGLKEDIIIKKRENFSQECLEALIQKPTENINSENCRLPQNTFTFDLQLDQGVSFHQVLEGINGQKGGTYYFTDEQNNYLFHFLPLVANDASGAKTNDLILTIEEDENLQDNNYLLKVSLDLNWLLDNQRQFPVTIDPSIVHDTEVEFDLSSALNRVESIAGPEVQIQNPYGGNDQFTKLLLHGDGADNSTTFSDSSMSQAQRKTITRNGDAKIEQDQSKFGGTSMYFDGSGDYLSVPSSSDWQLNDTWTLDTWVYPTNFYATYNTLYSWVPGGWLQIFLNGSGQIKIASNTENEQTWTNGSVSLNQWSHLAIVSSDKTVSIYINGNSLGSKTVTIPAGNAEMRIGWDTISGREYTGYMDEYRVSKGIARWTSNFTPPTRAYDGPKNYGVYNSPVIDSGDSGTDWQTITWTENGVQTGDGETPYSTDGLVAQWNFNETSGTTAVSGGSCGTSCNGTLTNMTTTGQDASTNSGWTANNGRWPKTNPAGLMFDGTDDRVSVSDNAFLEPNVFTIETWINTSASGVFQHIVTKGSSHGDDGYNGYYLRITSSGNLQAYLVTGTNVEYTLNSNFKVIPGNWYYVTHTYDGSSQKLYVNGVLDNYSVATGIIDYVGGSQETKIGYSKFELTSSYEYYFKGLIDSTRIYSRALSANEILSNYNSGNLEIQTRTGNSTDPNDGTWEDWKPGGSGTETAVLNMDEDSDNWEGKMDQYTKLLIHGDGTNGSTSFADKSLYTKTITPAGNAQISTAQSKFGNSAMYFDGTGDYLSVPNSSDFNFGTGDFTIDFWTYLNQYKTDGDYSVFFSNNTGATGTMYCTLGHNNQLSFIATGYASLNYETSSSEWLNKWSHISWVRNSGIMYLYINGELKTSSSFNYNLTATTPFIIGGFIGANETNGYVDELRISKGIARWTSNFTPPNQAYHNPSWLPVEENKVDNDGNTKLLLHGDGDNNSTNFIDSSFQEHSIAHVGDAKISTTQSKFGSSAMSFDGTGDYISVSDSDDWDLSGDFTIDFWVKQSISGGCYSYLAQYQTVNSYYWDFAHCAGQGLRFDLRQGGIYRINMMGGEITDNDWHHIVLTRINDNWTIYKDGISVATANYSSTLTFATDLKIGGNPDDYGFLNGSIDELRISKGIARWISNFTPPEAPHSDPITQKIEGAGSMKVEQGKSQCDSNTVAYWTLNETGGSGAYLKDVCGGNHGTPTGTTVTNGISGKARSFNGTSDYVSFNGSYPSSSMTLSLWYYATDNSTNKTLSADNNLIFHIMNGNYRIGHIGPGTDWTSSIPAQLKSWTNVVFVQNGDVASIYENGVFKGSASSTYNPSGSFVYLGNANPSLYNTPFSGQIDEVKISNIARTPEEIAEDYRMGRDHRLSRSLDATDFSSKNKIPFYVASDKTGTFMETTIGESAFANYEPDANTVGLWHLEEQTGTGAYIKDSAGSNHGTPTGTSFVEGKVGKGRYFYEASNSSSEAEFISVGTLSTSSISNFTISSWIKPTTLGHYGGIISPINSCRNNGWAFSVDDSNRISFYDANIGSVILYPAILNSWQLVTLIGNGSVLNLYLNGIKVASTPYSSNLRLDSMFIGKYECGNVGEDKWNFLGSLDELRIDNIARTASEIRQAYEVGRRTHPITIDFSASLDSANLITNSSDLSFTINSQTTGSPNKGDNLFNGDKIIIKENYDGTEYLSQGTVNSTNQSTGATTVISWDSGSTFPSAGFTQNATVFKWQKEYWDLSGITDNQKNAINRMTLRITDGSEARNIYLDDFKSSSSYLTNPTSSTISSSNNRYFQYRTIFSNNEQMSVSPVLSQISTTFRYQPTNNKLMRHGKWFKDNEQKSPGFFWAE